MSQTYRTYPPGAFDKGDAAYYIGVSVRALDQLQAQGELIPKRYGAKRLFLKEDLDDFLKRLSDWDEAS